MVNGGEWNVVKSLKVFKVKVNGLVNRDIPSPFVHQTPCKGGEQVNGTI
jgi:hypothetical protein